MPANALSSRAPGGFHEEALNAYERRNAGRRIEPTQCVQRLTKNGRQSRNDRLSYFGSHRAECVRSPPPPAPVIEPRPDRHRDPAQRQGDKDPAQGVEIGHQRQDGALRLLRDLDAAGPSGGHP